MKKLLDGYYAFLKIVLTILMGVLIVPVTMQIFARYFDFIPRYIWTEELARFCFIWIILVGAMIALRITNTLQSICCRRPRPTAARRYRGCLSI